MSSANAQSSDNPPDPLQEDPVGSLAVLARGAITFITQFEAPLYAIACDKPVTSSTSLPSPAQSQATHPLALSHDSSALIHAHTTKLALFISNDPFTPSEIVKLLAKAVPEAVPENLYKSLVKRKVLAKKERAGPITGIAAAAQLCQADQYTGRVRRHLAYQCYDVLRKFKSLLQAIPLDGKVLTGDAKAACPRAAGTVWAACDEIVNLKKLGIPGFLMQAVQSYRDDTMKDILEEMEGLQESMNETDEAEDDEEEDQSEEAKKVRERLGACLKKLRDTITLYTEISQRRMKTLPPLTGSESQMPIVKRLNDALPLLQGLPDKFNDLGCAFEELDMGEEVALKDVDELMFKCFFDAFTICEILAKPWKGDSDKFTKWTEEFKVTIKKPQ